MRTRHRQGRWGAGRVKSESLWRRRRKTLQFGVEAGAWDGEEGKARSKEGHHLQLLTGAAPEATLARPLLVASTSVALLELLLPGFDEERSGEQGERKKETVSARDLDPPARICRWENTGRREREQESPFVLLNDRAVRRERRPW